jgi:tRNA(Ile)-lysidine synthetase-like protein
VLVVRRVARRTAGRGSATEAPAAASDGAPPARALVDGLVLGAWRFVRVETVTDGGAERRDAWRAVLPAGVPLAVRPWRPGDRMRVAGAAAARRVKRVLADARVPARARVGWPVVVAVRPDGGEEIVWIPGVRRGAGGDGAPEGRAPAVAAPSPTAVAGTDARWLTFRCDRLLLHPSSARPSRSPRSDS